MSARIGTGAVLCLLGLSGLATAQTIQDQANTAVSTADWYERTVVDGVTVRSYRFDDLFSSRQVIHVTEIDMTNNASFEFPYLAGGSRKTVSAFAGDVTNAVAAVNGNFFSSSGTVQYLKIGGSVITTTQPAVDDRGGVSIDSTGDLHARFRDDVGGWASLSDPDIMATNVPVVINGSQFPFGTASFYTVDRHPRTLVGVTSDDKALFVVVDGRSSIADGMTFEETAAIMIALGAENAVNMDGGGSSTMWDSGSVGNGVTNVPSDGSQRTVVNAVAVASTNSAPAASSFDAQRAGTAANSSPHAPINVTVESGETATVTIEFVNTGTTTWTPSNVTLATSESFDHTSTIQHGSWVSPSRPTVLDTASVAPGATGTFEFTVQAPIVTALETIEESYVLIDGTSTPFGPHQNRLYLTVTPPADESDIVIESRVSSGEGGGVTPAPAYEETGSFSNTSSKSSVSNPAVTGAGGRYNFTVNSTATFRPTIAIAGNYDVYVTMGAGSNNNATASYIIDNAGADVTGSVDLTFTDSGLVNQWKLLESNVPFSVGNSEGITFTNTDGNSASGARFVMDAVRFELDTTAIDGWSLYSD